MKSAERHVSAGLRSKKGRKTRVDVLQLQRKLNGGNYPPLQITAQGLSISEAITTAPPKPENTELAPQNKLRKKEPLELDREQTNIELKDRRLVPLHGSSSSATQRRGAHSVVPASVPLNSPQHHPMLVVKRSPLIHLKLITNPATKSAYGSITHLDTTAAIPHDVLLPAQEPTSKDIDIATLLRGTERLKVMLRAADQSQPIPIAGRFSRRGLTPQRQRQRYHKEQGQERRLRNSLLEKLKRQIESNVILPHQTGHPELNAATRLHPDSQYQSHADISRQRPTKIGAATPQHLIQQEDNEGCKLLPQSPHKSVRRGSVTPMKNMGLIQRGRPHNCIVSIAGQMRPRLEPVNSIPECSLLIRPPFSRCKAHLYPRARSNTVRVKPSRRVNCIKPAETQEEEQRVVNLNNTEAMSSSGHKGVSLSKLNFKIVIHKKRRSSPGDHIALRKRSLSPEAVIDTSEPLISFVNAV